MPSSNAERAAPGDSGHGSQGDRTGNRSPNPGPVPTNEASGAAAGPSRGNSVKAAGRAMTEGHADTPPRPLSSCIEREPSATSSPASIVIGAARLDNVSTFPKSVAAVHVPDYPPLPSFLDRRKPSGTEANAA